MDASPFARSAPEPRTVRVDVPNAAHADVPPGYVPISITALPHVDYRVATISLGDVIKIRIRRPTLYNVVVLSLRQAAKKIDGLTDYMDEQETSEFLRRFSRYAAR